MMAALKAIRGANGPLEVIGDGSNGIVSDAGFRFANRASSGERHCNDGDMRLTN